MLRRAMSPPFGSSSLITSAPRNPRICAQAGPAWLWVISMTRMPDKALSMLILPTKRLKKIADAFELVERASRRDENFVEADPFEALQSLARVVWETDE